MSKCWRIEIWLATIFNQRSTSKKFQNRKLKFLGCFCWTFSITSETDNGKEIWKWAMQSNKESKYSQIQIHVKEDYKKVTGVDHMIKTKKAPKPCYMLQRFLGKLNEYLLQDKRLDGRRSTFFGLIPLISGSKVWCMVNHGHWWLFNIVLNIV